MKVIVTLRSGPLSRFLSFLWRILARPQAATPSAGTDLSPGRAAAPTDLPTVQVSQHPPPRPGRTERTLVVGVDFGTSTTKVIWQDLTDNHYEVVRWRADQEDPSAFLLPSTIVLRNGALYFGISENEACERDLRLSAIKLCVLCRRKPTICRCGNALVSHGMITLPDSADAVPASSFACLYLAHAFREVEGMLLRRFPKDDLVLIWNLGCPMDHLDGGNLRSEWERMTGAALKLRERISSPADMSLLAEATRLVEIVDVPPFEERNFYVQPEWLAAVKAFLESPYAEWKTYAIVDVGAGTTEVSFFFNGKAMSEPGQPFRPSYMAESTEAVGGAKIDQELAHAWGCSIHEARKLKESASTLIPEVQSIRDICMQYVRTCRDIVKSRKFASQHDRHFDLFVIGGGSRLQILQQRLSSQNLPGGFVRDAFRKLKPPRSLQNSAHFEPYYDFLSVACGLASSLEWKYYLPKDVSLMPQ